jgi:hypothetical protein
LRGQKFPDGEAHIGAINEILADIERMTLEIVFLELTERLQEDIEAAGEYLD